ncbi:MAG: sigma-70 family RNA polymerase sigma factor [Rhizobiaceae bacterium]|nr:MAG: sigma-70 family RNA polymerase sigma factor [Rhizobiaceae bacterium]
MPHLKDALAFARWLTGSRDDAEDVVQEACLRAYASIGGGTVLRPRAWLLAIVRNAAFTWMAKNRPKWLLASGDGTEMDRLAETGEASFTDLLTRTPEAELIRKADMAAVREAVAALPVRLREVLILREFNDLSYRDIADVLAVPIGTVMSRLSRARLLLAASLAEGCRD